ncbi:MAG: radical SAM protein [Candidatus Melainabacteria bacterium]|nr:radical SAM protein [Candidatus Melainabacteria bacterium]
MFTDEQELKFYVLAHGIKIDPAAEAAWHEQFAGPISLGEYASTSGACLYTQAGTYINAPFVESFTQSTEARLVFDGNFAVVKGNLTIPVSVIPVPAYHQQTYVDCEKEYPYTNLGVTHTDRCRISPIEGCAWVCKFCDMPFEKRYRRKPMDQLLKVIELAKDDKLSPARHVLISGGTPKAYDEPWVDEVYAYIAEHSPIPVDVMMPARKDMTYPVWLRSVGVNMVSINIEVFDVERAKRIIPSKARHLGLNHYLDYIEASVSAFGVGFVQSLVVFGQAIEPIESTLAAVKALAKRGCMPVLSAFRPDFTTPMGKEPPATMEEIKHVYIEAMDICENSGSGVKLGPRCMACQHNTITFPDGSDFYVGPHESLTHLGGTVRQDNHAVLPDKKCA